MRRSSFAETFPVTSFLLVTVIAAYVLETVADWKLTQAEDFSIAGPIDGRVTLLLGSLRLGPVLAGEWWRVVGAAFLHANLLHVAMNGLVLWDLGRHCEPFLSSWKFLVIYVASAVGGSIGSLAWSWLISEPGRQAVGASGALCGLIGVLLVHSVRSRDVDLRNALLRWIGYIVLVGFLLPLQIDHAAHLGGFLVGAAFGLGVGSHIDSRSAERWRYPGYAAGALCLAAIGFGVLNYLRNRPGSW